MTTKDKLQVKTEKYRSEFNAAVEFLKHLAELRKNIDYHAILARMGETDHCRPYYSFLFQYYINLETFMWDAEKKQYLESFRKVTELFDTDSLTIMPSVLDDIATNLYNKTQRLGLNVPVSRKRVGAVRLKSEVGAEE